VGGVGTKRHPPHSQEKIETKKQDGVGADIRIRNIIASAKCLEVFYLFFFRFFFWYYYLGQLKIERRAQPEPEPERSLLSL
jgi:hypothetical protein